MLAGLAALPERDRAVIELVDIAGLRPQEAASALGLAPGTVRMRLLRARARLRKEAQRKDDAAQARQQRPRSKVTAMTKFEDQLFDDLMREHGSTLTHAKPPAPRRHVATRRTLLAVGGGGVAVAAAAGVLVATAGGNGPATAATRRPARPRPTR